MLTSPRFKPDEEQKRKIRTFHRLSSVVRELDYEAFPDTLYADLNLTLTDKDLAMCMLRHLDKDIEKAAEKIIKTDESRADKVRSIAKCVKGKTLVELIEASKKAVDEINVPTYIREELKRLKPTTDLVIYTHIPMETARIYIRRRIDPLYNYDGETKIIIFYATVLQHRNEVLTGEILFMPDENFRRKLKSRRKEYFQSKISGRSV